MKSSRLFPVSVLVLLASLVILLPASTQTHPKSSPPPTAPVAAQQAPAAADQTLVGITLVKPMESFKARYALLESDDLAKTIKLSETQIDDMKRQANNDTLQVVLWENEVRRANNLPASCQWNPQQDVWGCPADVAAKLSKTPAPATTKPVTPTTPTSSK